MQPNKFVRLHPMAAPTAQNVEAVRKAKQLMQAALDSVVVGLEEINRQSAARAARTARAMPAGPNRIAPKFVAPRVKPAPAQQRPDQFLASAVHHMQS